MAPLARLQPARDTWHRAPVQKQPEHPWETRGGPDWSLERVSCHCSLSDVYLPPFPLLLDHFREQGGSEMGAADFASRKGGLEKPASRKAAFSPVKMALTYIWFPQYPDHHELRMASNMLTCFGEKVAKERRDSVPETEHKIQHFQQAKLLGLMLRPPEQVKEEKGTSLAVQGLRLHASTAGKRNAPVKLKKKKLKERKRCLWSHFLSSRSHLVIPAWPRWVRLTQDNHFPELRIHFLNYQGWVRPTLPLPVYVFSVLLIRTMNCMIRTSIFFFFFKLPLKIFSGFLSHRLIMGFVHLFIQQTLNSNFGPGLQSQVRPAAGSGSLVRTDIWRI